MTLHLSLLLIYGLILIGIGLWVGRRVRDTNDFFVAGRRLKPGLLFSTMLAANIGAGSTVGATELGYRIGLSAWWWVGSAGIGSLVLAFWVGPRMHQLATRHKFKTVGDFLEHRYDRNVRAVIAVLLWLGTLIILAAQLLAIAFVLNVITGLPQYVGCIIGGVVIMTYFSAGGLLTSAWVNVIQLCMLLIGFMLAVPFALFQGGGLETVFTNTEAIPEYWNFLGGSRGGWIYLPMLVPAFIVSPGLLQKVYGAADEHTVRRAVGWSGLVLLLFAFVPAFLGAIARSAYPDLINPGMALPLLLMESLPPLIGAIGLVALFSAEVSSADAILFMLSTSLSQDLYRRFINREANDSSVLKVARRAAIGGGTLALLIAIFAKSIITVMSVFYTLLTVSLFVPIVMGLYIRKIGTPEVLSAIAAGLALVVTVEIISIEQTSGVFTSATLGVIASVTVCMTIWAARRYLTGSQGSSNPPAARL